jgi:4-hydroxybenzoate polyprenyltransferase
MAKSEFSFRFYRNGEKQKMPTLAQRWMGRGNVIKKSYTLTEKWAGLADITRPILTVMGALGVASAAALANQGFPKWNLALAGLLAALLAYAAIHAFNDFVDSRRDVECWPGRPIPSQRLKTSQVLAFVIACFAGSLIIIWFSFNVTCFIVSCFGILMGCLYSAYLRDRVGYLVLPPIQGLLWLCGWTAFSPDTLFTSWLPWLLYLFSACWQAGHIMVYSPLHPIRKFGGKTLTQVPALFVTTSPRTASVLGFIFLVTTLGMGIYLGIFAGLGLLFLLPFILMGLVTIFVSYRFMLDSANFGKGMRSFTYATYFMLVARVAILLCVFLFFKR